MPFKWTAEAELILLVGAIKQCDAKPPVDYFDTIAAVLGPETNANGCRQRFYALKREADAALAKASGDPSTPAGAKKTTKKTVASSGKKRKTVDDPEASETPTKAAKKSVKGKPAAKFNTKESDDESESSNTVRATSVVENDDEDEV